MVLLHLLFYFIKGSKFNSTKFSKILLNRNNIAVVPGIGYEKVVISL